jgi:hypothetical protein
VALDRFRIEAWDKYLSPGIFKPLSKIGNNVIFNTDIHISALIPIANWR